MKKHLLLTTAIVAFAMPSYADSKLYTYEDDMGKVSVEGKINNSTWDSYVVYVPQTATIASKSSFKNNHGGVGGAITIAKKTGEIIIGDNTIFEGNIADYDGGAIGNYGGAIIAENIKFLNNQAQLKASQDSGQIGGGAISLGIDATLDVENGYFEGNSSGFNGGAIATRRTLQKDEYGTSTENHYISIINSTFVNNSATDSVVDVVDNKGTAKTEDDYKDKGGNGGAISNYFNKASVTGSTFKNNHADNSGGAIHNAPLYDMSTHAKRFDTGNITIDSSTFNDNTAGYQGGAILSAIGASVTITGKSDQNVFKNNHAYYDGGAIASFGELSISNALFEGNTAHYTGDEYSVEVADSIPMGGGAIALGAVSDTHIASISNTIFKNNRSGTNGGAIGTRLGSDANNSQAKLDIDATFNGNKAKLSGGAIYNTFYADNGLSKGDGVTVKGEFTSNTAGVSGGAIYNDGSKDKAGNYGGKMVITDSTFTGNIAGTSGGAIYNTANAILSLNGTNVFSGNGIGTTDNMTSYNDIYNDGALNVTGSLTLDGGITGTGTTTFESGSNLTVQANKTTIDNSVTNNGATLNMIFDTGFTGEYQLITGSLDKEFEIADNTLYDIKETDAKGTYTISKKSTEEIADNLGLSSDEASALTAATSSAGSSGNASFDEVVSQLNQAAQAGDSSVAKEVSKLGADTNPVVASQEASSHDVLFSVVSNELNGAGGAIAEGKSSGDFFKKATAWVRGLFNKADRESTSKSAGFNSDTYGVAFGIDKELDNNVRAGFGYANSQTDIDSSTRDTDVDTNSLFVYAKYKPADWYVNTMLAYSWSEYDEKKSILGVNAGAKYDVDTIALQSMYGYETKFKSYDLAPEFGFRYLHIDHDSYTDKLGSKVASNQEDVLTLVAGAKIAKDYTLDNGTILRPELKAALTYDLFDADNSANVLLANGAGYTVDGEKLDRLGFELGAKVSTFATEKTELSAGYLTRFREDYQDHTLTFDIKYNF